MTIIILLGVGETLALIIPGWFILYGLAIIFIYLRDKYRFKIRDEEREFREAIDRRNIEKENELKDLKNGEGRFKFTPKVFPEDGLSREMKRAIKNHMDRKNKEENE